MATTPQKDFSVVVPVYNSAETLAELFGQLQAVFGHINATFDVIFVNDRSTDQSWAVINRLKEQYRQQVVGIDLSRNFGQQGATFCGITHATGRYLLTIDDDLEQSPADVPKLLAFAQKHNYDLVYGVCNNRDYGFWRKILTTAFRRIQKIESEYSGRGSSFRLIHESVYKNVQQNRHGFAFIDEVLLWHTDNIGTVDIAFYSSKKNVSTHYNIIQLFLLSFNLVFFSSLLPIRFITFTGLFFSCVNLLIAFFYAYKRLVKGVSVPGYTSLMVSIFLTSSIILFCLGIIGEYISKIYKIQKREPLYSIKKII